MPSKKGSKYLNAKTYSILSKYTPEDIQKLLNSGQFKSVIARTLGVSSSNHKKQFQQSRKFLSRISDTIK